MVSRKIEGDCENRLRSQKTQLARQKRQYKQDTLTTLTE